MKRITYKDSGVDIKKAGAFKKGIKGLVRKSFSRQVLRDIGGFGSFFSFESKKYKEPVLISSADGVGTKLKIAVLAGRHDSVGIDAVAMNVNDILCVGARPLFFLDYIAYSRLKPGVLVEVVKGLNRGCIIAGSPLIGGETAQMPGMYRDNDYDLAGFCVGAADRRDIIDGSKIKAGDAIIGLESNGIHSNGYSLVRKVLSQKELKRLSAELLKPTRIYVKPVLALLDNPGLKKSIKGIAHITGGAFYDKIARILPKNTGALVDKHSWKAPEIFRLIQRKGNIADKEMYHTFNMGMGMVLVVDKNSAPRVILALKKFGLPSRIIGKITRGNKQVEIV